MSDVDIIIPCWNHDRYTARCLMSLLRTKHDFRAILIDNGSTDKTEGLFNWFKAQRPETVTVKNEDNLGFVRAMNQGFALADADVVIQCNNDVEFVDPDWLDLLLAHFTDGVGAVGPVSTYVLWHQWVTLDGLPDHHENTLLSGFCLALSRECLEDVKDASGSILDERFGMGGNDDLDLCIRIGDAGYKLVVGRDVFVKHEGSVSLKTYTKERYGSSEESMADVNRLDVETRQTLVDKWGQERVNKLLIMPPEYEGKHS
jgi:GT2 family glycosyltransferase